MGNIFYFILDPIGFLAPDLPMAATFWFLGFVLGFTLGNLSRGIDRRQYVSRFILCVAVAAALISVFAVTDPFVSALGSSWPRGLPDALAPYLSRSGLNALVYGVAICVTQSLFMRRLKDAGLSRHWGYCMMFPILPYVAAVTMALYPSARRPETQQVEAF